MNIVEQPLVSVIVPVYNVELYLDECLDSIKLQTYKNLEIIVVEDCSTDSSMQVLQPHLTDKRIKLIQHANNKGLSVARNAGIEAATGEYMMFVDSDDIVDIRLVAACVDCAINTGADLVTYGFTLFIDGIASIELPFPSSYLEFTPSRMGNEYFSLDYFSWAKFIRSSVLQPSQIRFPVGLYYEDFPFHWHLGLSVNKIYQLPIDFYLYRKRSSSITDSKGQELLDIFVVQTQIMIILQDYKAYELKSVLANRIKLENLNILTSIDSNFLISALDQAKKLERLMQVNGYKSDLTYRNVLVTTVTRAPLLVGLTILKIRGVALRNIFLPSLKVRRRTLDKIAELKVSRRDSF